MAKFILRRLLWVIPVMLGVVLIVFTIDRVGPGDPVAAALGGTYTQEQYDAKEAELGLDRPFLVQFFSYLQGIITRGDLGDSFQTGLPVGQTILQRFPLTLELAIISIIIAVGLGIPFRGNLGHQAELYPRPHCDLLFPYLRRGAGLLAGADADDRLCH